MKTFNLEVRRTDEYQIKIDENVWTEDKLKDWSSIFFKVEDTDELAEIIAKAIMREGSDSFIEGFGYFKIVDENGKTVSRYIDESKYCPGIEIHIIEEDDYLETNFL